MLSAPLFPCLRSLLLSTACGAQSFLTETWREVFAFDLVLCLIWSVRAPRLGVFWRAEWNDRNLHTIDHFSN